MGKDLFSQLEARRDRKIATESDGPIRFWNGLHQADMQQASLECS